MYDKEIDYNEAYSMHRRDVGLLDETVSPKLGGATYVAASATVAGNVELWDGGTVFENVVLRGDLSLIRIGMNSSIGSGSVIDCALEPLDPDHDGSTIVGHHVTVEANCMIRAATIHDSVLIGAGSVVLDGAEIQRGAIIGPGSVVDAGVVVPAGQYWQGNPAKYVRDISEHEIETVIVAASRRVEEINISRRTFELDGPNMGAIWQAEREKLNVGVTHVPFAF
jgi:gamma-carbonic anhydrase